eukprot:jgi/Bigna1/80054/fgenesh1_pg.67_\
MSKSQLPPPKPLQPKPPIQRLPYNLPTASPLPGSNPGHQTRNAAENTFLAASKNDRQAVKLWKMQADERLQLHKAYTESVQNQGRNSFELSKQSEPEWLAKKSAMNGGKVGRAMGDRWRRTSDQVGPRTMARSSDKGLDDPIKEDMSRRLRERMMTETRRKRENWEIKSAAARDFKASLAGGGQKTNPWAENGHVQQQRHLLSQTLKERERLYSQNDRLISMAREVEVLSEKLRISEALVAKQQTKLRNSDMFLKNLELELNARVPKAEFNSVLSENEMLKKRIDQQKEHTTRSEIRVSQLQKQLDMITKMQLMADSEESGMDPTSPTRNASSQNMQQKKSSPEAKPKAANGESKTTKPVSVKIEVPKDGSQFLDLKPNGTSSEATAPKLVSTKTFPISKHLSQSIKESLLNTPEEHDPTTNAVTLLQQYIRNLIAENQHLKKSIEALEKPDPKRQLFSEFVQLKRQNSRMRRILDQVGVDESMYVKKPPVKSKITTH